MDIERDIERIVSLAKVKEDENRRFRTFLKGVDLSLRKLDSIVREHYEFVAGHIDCCACANCCTVLRPVLSARDIGRLAGHLQTPRKSFISDYLQPAEDEPGYAFCRTPCPFLQEKRCSVYEARPEVCRSFPNLHKREFVFRLIQVVGNCSVCPIVYNVMERLKLHLWGRRHRR
jgi:uncharacterized protein